MEIRDKYLKVSRIIKKKNRKANEARDSGRYALTKKWQEPVQRLRWGMIEIAFGTKAVKVKRLQVCRTRSARKTRKEMFEYL